VPAVFGIGLELLCLVLVSMSMTGGLYARYTASASGSDAARVAKFDVGYNFDGAGQVLPVSFVPGQEYECEITNSSEVAVTYALSITGLDPALFVVNTSPYEAIAPGGAQTITFSIDWASTSGVDPAYAEQVYLATVQLQIVQVD
jgi:hypothetical protein